MTGQTGEVPATDRLPTVLIPALSSTPRLYTAQLSELWRFGPVMIADHTRDDSMAAIARYVLDRAPARFALAGLSMGGYIALEIMRQAPERVAKLALLDTSARADTSEQSERRRSQITLAETGRFADITEQTYPTLVHPARNDDQALRDVIRLMAQETGPEAFIRQQRANLARIDSRPHLAAIRCPTLVLIGDTDAIIPREHAAELVAAITHAQLVVVADSGHLPTLEQPQAVSVALRTWLET
jgi:pimeloyl-ACP methyl ester carboxylesterase